MEQLQCYTAPVIWMPGVLADDQSANFIAPLNRLLGSWPLTVPFGAAVDLGDDSGILGPLDGWTVGTPTFAAENPFVGAIGSAVMTGAQGAVKIDPSAMLNQATVTFTVWFRITSKTGAQRILHYGTGAGTTFTLRYSSVLDRVAWHVIDAGSTHEVLTTGNVLGSPALNTWYFAHCWFNGLTKTAGLHIWPDGIASNNGALLPEADETAVPFGKNPAAGNLTIGYGPAGERFRGNLYDVSAWSRILNYDEAAWVYISTAYAWPVFTPAEGEVNRPETPDAPTDLLFDSGLITFTDNTEGRYQHEIWMDDGAGYFSLIATLDPGVTSCDASAGDALSSFRARSIGRGHPSAFVTYGGAYFMSRGRVVLQSDDLQWYSVGLSTNPDTGAVMLDIDQVPVSAPAYGAAAVSFSVGPSVYLFSLVTVDGETFEDIDQTPSGGTPVAVLELQSDDGRRYDLALVDQSGTITPDIEQAEQIVLEPLGSAAAFVDADWVEAAESDSYEVQFKIDAGAWQLAGVVVGITALNFDSGAGDSTTVTVRVRPIIGGLNGPWSNLQSILIEL